jgi:Ca2+-binding EF-hand superfamily protein
MRTLAIAACLALGLAPAALAQTKPSAPAATTDAAAEAKFKAADKNNNGSLEGAELEAHKAIMVQVDKNKDGKLSRAEFMSGVKAGQIK